MDHVKAMYVFNKRFPKRIVTRCVDYDKDHFVVEAVEKLDEIDYNNPYFGIDKRSGKITAFLPNLDMDAFFDAIENRTVYLIG